MVSLSAESLATKRSAWSGASCRDHVSSASGTKGKMPAMSSASSGPTSLMPRLDDGVMDPCSLLSSIGEVVYSWDMRSDELVWGPSAAEVLGKIPPEAMSKGLAFARLVEPGSGRSRYDAIVESNSADSGEGVVYRTRYAAALGSRKMWIEDTGRWFTGNDGRPARARGVLRIERPVRDEELTSAGREMCDRMALVERLEASLAEHLPGKRSVVVLIGSIDELARLNDDFGHEATDEIISVVQDRLRSVMRSRDQLVRYSGNRFAITLVGCPAPQIEAAARRFIRAVSKSAIETARGIALIRLRVGAAHAPSLTRHGGAMLTAAEHALSDAKIGGVESAVVARKIIQRSTEVEPEAIEMTAIAALNDRRVQLALQPVVHARSGEVGFHEALLRVERPDGTFFQPADLVPVLERRGLVRLFDHRVLELAMEVLAADPSAKLSLNVSPRSLGEPEWIEAFMAMTSQAPDCACRVIVEVTETATIDDPDRIAALLNRIKGQGARVAIDDFGAGHTSLRHLRAFPIDILKLDGAFTQNLRRSTDDRFFVRTLLDLARHLNVETVAEWVDDQVAADMLIDWGVTYLQGHLVGRAMLWQRPAAPVRAVA